MGQLKCDLCDGADLMKQDGVFVCQTCGVKYSVEEVRKMLSVNVIEPEQSIIDSEELQQFIKAARQGDAEAQYNLGVCYEYGKGVPQDDAQAAEWFKKAAEQGYAEAQCQLGFFYENGMGVPQDDVKA